MSVFKDSESYRPFQFPFAVTAEKSEVIEKYWHEDQIDLQDDLRQYFSKDGLATKDFSHDQNKKILDTLLLFFTQLDMSVASGYVDLLYYTKNNEIKSLFIQHAAKEVRHQRAYALAGETFGFSDADWSSFKLYKEMVDKVDLIAQVKGDLNEPINYAKKLTSILLGEGIGLFTAFTSLLNLKRFGKVIGFNDINSWSLTDEEGHVENNIAVLQCVIKELTHEQLIELKEYTKTLVDEYVNVEKSIVDVIGDQQGLSKSEIKSYIEYLGRLRLYKLGYVGYIDVGENPLPWMEEFLLAERHGSFFEKKIADYSHSKLQGDISYNKYLTILEV